MDTPRYGEILEARISIRPEDVTKVTSCGARSLVVPHSLYVMVDDYYYQALEWRYPGKAKWQK